MQQNGQIKNKTIRGKRATAKDITTKGINKDQNRQQKQQLEQQQHNNKG